MVKEFETAVKSTPSNTITPNVVQTEFGSHVIFVKENDEKNGRWTVSHILAPVAPSEKTIAAKIEKLNKVKADLEAGTLAFDKKIDEDVIQTFDVKGITPDGNIPNITYSPEIAQAVFNAPINKVGFVNDLKLAPTKYTILLFQKTKEVKPEAANFEKSKTEVENDYKNMKVAEYMSKLF